MAEDAASGWILTELEDGKRAPEATPVQRIKTEAGQFTSLVALDMDAYAAKYGKNAVKKTLTIPAWLNTFAEQNGISCSKVLQDALSRMSQAGQYIRISLQALGVSRVLFLSAPCGARF